MHKVKEERQGNRMISAIVKKCEVNLGGEFPSTIQYEPRGLRYDPLRSSVPPPPPPPSPPGTSDDQF